VYLLKDSPTSDATRSSLSYSPEASTGPYTEPDQYTPTIL
jgi:hypothetical protein